TALSSSFSIAHPPLLPPKRPLPRSVPGRFTEPFPNALPLLVAVKPLFMVPPKCSTAPGQNLPRQHDLNGAPPRVPGICREKRMFTPARKSMPAIDYVSIVRSVYGDRRAMVIGALGCVVCTCVTGYVTGSAVFFLIAAGFLLACLVRFADMTALIKADVGPLDVEAAARWEIRATYHGAIFAFLCGIWCFAGLV